MASVDPRVLLIAAIATLAGGCVTMPPEDDPVLLKIGELDARLRTLEQRLNNDALIDMAGEVARLQDEVRTLRGEVDLSRNEMATLEENQRNVFVQLDDRMNALEASGVAAPLVAGAVAGGAAGTDAALAATLSDRELYDQGFDLLKQQQYAAAGEVFAELVRTQPESSLAGAAQYWYGETFYVRREFETALASFNRVVSDYPRSSKAADALLKLGFCQYELGRYVQAKADLTRVTEAYAGSPAARLAAERLERMRNEGR
jgi:tol-pal system protein YbgF